MDLSTWTHVYLVWLAFRKNLIVASGKFCFKISLHLASNEFFHIIVSKFSYLQKHLASNKIQFLIFTVQPSTTFEPILEDFSPTTSLILKGCILLSIFPFARWVYWCFQFQKVSLSHWSGWILHRRLKNISLAFWNVRFELCKFSSPSSFEKYFPITFMADVILEERNERGREAHRQAHFTSARVCGYYVAENCSAKNFVTLRKLVEGVGLKGVNFLVTLIFSS